MFVLPICYMVSTIKPKSITVTVLDRNTNKSRSLTVYGSDLEEVYKAVKKTFT